jgi:hypothetical protein
MHDSLFYKLQEAYNLMEEEIPTEWYHGTPSPITSFSDEFVGNGIDQEGPGIYLTSNYEDAVGYARKSESGTGVVYQLELNFRKLVPLNKKAIRKEIIQMIDWAPELETFLSNWDENPKKAKLIALNSILNSKNAHDSFQSVWFDFYKNSPIDYVRNMVSLGYDGVMVPRSFMNTKHIIVYNPRIIKVVDQL